MPKSSIDGHWTVNLDMESDSARAEKNVKDGCNTVSYKWDWMGLGWMVSGWGEVRIEHLMVVMIIPSTKWVFWEATFRKVDLCNILVLGKRSGLLLQAPGTLVVKFGSQRQQ